MKALVRDRYGSPDVLEVREIEQPVPSAHEVLVRVYAASINDWDWAFLHKGGPFGGSRPPVVRILGSDVAGTVAAVGTEVKRFRIGDEVYGDLSRFGSGGWGGFAEYVCAPERALVLKPSRMTFVQAAALPQAGQLAVQGLAANGSLKRGQKILINGGGGGVGTIGVQLAKAHDVEVTGVDSGAKLEMMRRIGFDHVIDYEREDFTKRGHRYDLILDTKTTRSPFEHTRALNRHGTYASVGGVDGKLMQLLLLGWCVRLTTGTRARLIMLRQNRDLAVLNERFETGQLRPVIDGPYPLSGAREAFRHFGAAKHKGKIVITIE